MDNIPNGLSMADEHEVIRKLQWRESKEEAIRWMMGLADWQVKADLTYAIETAAPEQVEKRVRWWLRHVAPSCRAICGIEYQQRGSAHAHVIIDCRIDFKRARELWQDGAGYCWLQAIRKKEAALGYAIKDAIKRGEVTLFGPGALHYDTTPRTRAQRQFNQRPKTQNPNDYESEALAQLSRQVRPDVARQLEMPIR